MGIFGIFSFLSVLIPILFVISIVQSISKAIFKQQSARKKGQLSNYQRLINEVNQEKERLRNAPTKKNNAGRSQDKMRAIEQEAKRMQQTRTSRRNASAVPANSRHSNYEKPLVSKTENQKVSVQAESPIRQINTPVLDTKVQPINDFVHSKTRKKKHKKQSTRQKELLKGIVYKEILDKPRSMRPYR